MTRFWAGTALATLMADTSKEGERRMRRVSFPASVLIFFWFLVSHGAAGQNLDGAKVQIHGYATQALLYSTNNNWNTTDSSDGSLRWTEGVLSVTSNPKPRFRLGVQARYFMLGSLTHRLMLDWAEGDFKANERFGVRVGKVKTPIGLWSETQDIDPAHLWILLPQSVYPLLRRSVSLAHFGGVTYGSVPLSESLGKLEYRIYGGERVLAANDAYFTPYRDVGIEFPRGLKLLTYGGALIWKTPVRGLELGATEGSEALNPASLTFDSLPGTLRTSPTNYPHMFARYENTKFMFAGEYNRLAPHATAQITGLPPIYQNLDERAYYIMSSYQLARRLTGGAYFSSIFNLQAPVSSARYQKDWVVSGRYEANSFLYVKAEQHFMSGTYIGYSSLDNPNGLVPKTSLTLLNVGVSF